MEVALKIRRADIKKFIRLADRDKAPKDQVWLVFLRITDCIGHFQAGSASADFPVHGLSTGFARFPLSILRRMMDSRNSTEVELGFSCGIAVCGNNSEASEHIEIGMVLDKRIGEVVYPSQLELLVVGRALSKEVAGELGIEKLLESAKSRMERQVAEAIGLLELYGVAPSRVEELVEQAISSAEAQIRARFHLDETPSSTRLVDNATEISPAATGKARADDQSYPKLSEEAKVRVLREFKKLQDEGIIQKAPKPQ